MTRSLLAGHPVTVAASSGVADGLLAVRPGDVTFNHIQALVDRIDTVNDDDVIAAVKWIYDRARLVAEPSGAAAVAAALGWSTTTWRREAAGSGPAAPGSAVAVISGGNVEAGAFGRYITSARHA
jgi:threonine dehydratase